MKITKSQLDKLIKEAVDSQLNEAKVSELEKITLLLAEIVFTGLHEDGYSEFSYRDLMQIPGYKKLLPKIKTEQVAAIVKRWATEEAQKISKDALRQSKLVIEELMMEE